jgi:hypothetical protein
LGCNFQFQNSRPFKRKKRKKKKKQIGAIKNFKIYKIKGRRDA